MWKPIIVRILEGMGLECLCCSKNIIVTAIVYVCGRALQTQLTLCNIMSHALWLVGMYGAMCKCISICVCINKFGVMWRQILSQDANLA